MATEPHFYYAYVLHTRPYRNTSALVELFTKENGRIAVVARGIRKAQSAGKNYLQPFTELLVSYRGKKEGLQTLTYSEHGISHLLLNKALFAGLYLNELLMYLLQHADPHPQLYAAYQQAMNDLEQATSIEISLRKFEKILLSELGYALSFTIEADTQMAINAEAHYQYIPSHGFVEIKNERVGAETHFSGHDLIAIAASDFSQETTLRAAKIIFRQLIASLLGHRTLKTRDLFMVGDHS